jgi:hypothetical protein
LGYEKGSGMTKQREFTEFVPKETVKDVLEYPFRGLESRGVRKDVCEKYQVRAGVSEADGKTVEAFYFPSYNQKGVITGFKKQDLLKEKSEKYHWSTVGSVTIGNKLFGQQQSESVQRKRVTLTALEGEWDMLSCAQAMCDQVKGTKFEGMEPFVVSIPMGTANAVESMLHNGAFVKSFTDLQIMFDDDCCTPAEKSKNIMKGHEAREAVASAFMGAGLNLATVTPPAGFKDASDMLQAGKSEELAKLVQFGGKRFITEKIAFASDVDFEEFIAPRKVGLMTPSFPMLMEKIEGWRLRELSLLFSSVGSGKSTVVASLVADFNAAGEKVGLIFLEEELKETLQRMVAHRLKVNYNKFKRDPLSCATREQIKEAYDYMDDDQKIVMLKHFGNLPITELMNKVKHMHLVCGCKYIAIDHLTLCVSGGEKEVDERKSLDRVMTELGAFCASNDVHIIAISHINRSGIDVKPPKEGKDGPEPYWITLNTSALRGSAALEQLSWNIFALETQIMPDRSRGHVRLVVVKNRPIGRLGVCDTFRLNDETGAIELQEEVVHEF